jgi:hypothetical protein
MMPKRREFALYLISTMDRSPDRQREGALALLEASAEDMQDARRSVGDRLSPIHTKLDDFEEMIGPCDRRDDGADLTILEYDFQTWPEFTFEIRCNADGRWTDAFFRRRTGLEVPFVTAPEELSPWGFTRDEVAGRFGPLIEGDIWPPFEEYQFTKKVGVIAQVTYTAIFGWQLLQGTPELAR